MAEHEITREDLERLRRVKDGLEGPDGRTPTEHAHPLCCTDETEQPDGAMNCINCGYTQHEGGSTRCPECGLPMVRWYRDATGWTAASSAFQGWFEAARSVWAWDRRTLARTGYTPTTAESRRFATWAAGTTAAMLGISIAFLDTAAAGPRWLQGAHFLLLAGIGVAIFSVYLGVVLLGLTKALSTTWRRRYPFVPACLHYSTAWWPMYGFVLLVLSCAYGMSKHEQISWYMGAVSVVGVLTWGAWLWYALERDGRIRFAATKIVGASLLSACLSVVVLWSIPGTTRVAMTQALSVADSGLAKFRMFGTVRGGAPQRGSQTFALVIDAIPRSGDEVVVDRIGLLGAGPTTRVQMRGAECRLQDIDDVLLKMRQELRPTDRFILYVNGHGAQQGSGAIQVADGYITSQMLTSHVQSMPTPHCLVIIESCYGGKFLDAFRRKPRMSAVVLTSTDDQNLAWGRGLTDFWQSLVNADCDENNDGEVSVREAFWSSYRDMLTESEKARAYYAEHSRNVWLREKVETQGYSTPQLMTCGRQTTDDEFAVPLPKQPAATGDPGVAAD